jgi:hypothetical protein
LRIVRQIIPHGKRKSTQGADIFQVEFEEYSTMEYPPFTLLNGKKVFRGGGIKGKICKAVG